MSRHHEKISSSMLRSVQTVLARGIADPRLEGTLLTATSLKLSEDLRSATVFVSVYPIEKTDLAMQALASAASHVRHEIAHTLRLKRTPDVAFRADPAARKHAEVLRALAAVRAEDPEPAEPNEAANDHHNHSQEHQ